MSSLELTLMYLTIPLLQKTKEQIVSLYHTNRMNVERVRDEVVLVYEPHFTNLTLKWLLTLEDEIQLVRTRYAAND